MWPPPHKPALVAGYAPPACRGTSDPGLHSLWRGPSVWLSWCRQVVRGVGARTPHARAPLPPPPSQHVHFPLSCLPGRTRRTSVHVAAACSLSVICHVPPVHGRLGHRPARSARSGVELGRAPTGGCRLGHPFLHPRARLPPRGPCRRRRAPPPCRRSSSLPPVTPPPVVRAIRGGGSRGPGPSACCGWCRVWRELWWSVRLSRPTVRAELARAPRPSPPPCRWRPRA